MITKSLDNIFLNYGVRKEDMALIERVCQEDGIDFEWLRDSILKPYNDAKNKSRSESKQGQEVEPKHLKKIFLKALREIDR